MNISAIFAGQRERMHDIMGPLVDLSTIAGESDYAVIRSIVPPKTLVPLHSHPDRETLLILEGKLSVWRDASWRIFAPGDIVEIRSNMPHALKNEGPDEVALVLITSATMASFLAEIGIQADHATVSPERLNHFQKTASAYGYWNGDAAAQKAIGIEYDRTAPAPPDHGK